MSDNNREYKRLRTSILFTIVIPQFLILTLFAQSPDEEAVDGGRLKVGYVLRTPIKINPLVVQTEYEREINQLIFGEGLYKISNEGEIEHGLTKSSTREIDEGLLINLRSDIIFQDGSQITTDDVKFTLELYKKFALQSQILHSARFIRSIRVLNRKSLKIYIDHSISNFKNTIGQLPILPKKYYSSWNNYNLISDMPDTRPVGSGHYLFRRQLNSEIHLDVNRNHYNGRAFLDGIDFIFFQIQEQLIDAFLQEKVDLVQVQDRSTIEQIHRITQNRDYKLTFERKNLKLYYILLNTQKTPFDNINIRKAINFAIYKPSLVEKILYNKGHVAKNILDEGLKFFLKGTKIDIYDPLSSMNILKSEGYQRNDEGKLINNNRELNFELFFEKGSSYEEAIARLMSINLGELGINIIPHPMAPYELEFRLVEGRYQAALQYFIYDPIDPEVAVKEFYLHKLNKENGFKTFNNRYINQLIKFSERNPSEIRRRQIMDQIQQRINQNFSCIFLFFEEQVYYAINNRFENFRNISYEKFKFIIKLNTKNEWFVPKDKQKY